ncbi:MAG: T9SS type A sorting domain-containing protein, partial [Bacteroidia bacterium]
HTFGNTNNPGVSCGDDGISDTPPTMGYFSTCPTSASGNTCNIPAGTANVENIMDYSSCPKMFTTGQVNVMRAAAASSTNGRNNLWSAANLVATDVNGTSVCTPIADLQAPTYTICAGQSLTFTDISYNASVTARSWAATGGATIGSPGNSPTSITFPNAGTQTVTINAGNSTGTTTATKIVTVLPGLANIGTTYAESFENPGLPANFTIYNLGTGTATNTTWVQNTSGAAATGNNSYWINGAADPAGATDILETPSYDFASNTGAVFTFKYAYARYNTSNVDVFKVQASYNCGGSWTDIIFGVNSSLCTGSGGTTTTPFIPTPSAFKTYTLTNHPGFNVFKTQSNVRIRFTFIEDPTNGYGNNVYLDDINFSTALGTNELTQSIGFNVYPNPTNGVANIEFTLSNPATVKYSVTDITGRIVENERTAEMEVGSHTLTVNQNQKLKTGVYFVNFELNGQKMSRKIIVE